MVSATAGWGGSLPAEVAAQRLRQAFTLAELSPEEFVGALLPTMFSETAARGSVDAFEASMRAPRPVAEDLHASIAGSRLVVLADAGHVCNIEVPEEFNTALRSFLRERERPGPPPAVRSALRRSGRPGRGADGRTSARSA